MATKGEAAAGTEGDFAGGTTAGAAEALHSSGHRAYRLAAADNYSRLRLDPGFNKILFFQGSDDEANGREALQ